MVSRALHLRSSNGLWGPENQILLLARYLPGEGFEASAMVLYRSQSTVPIHPLVAAMHRTGLEAEQIPNPWLPLESILVVTNRLQRGQFGILHTHGYKADLIGLVAARRAGVRWVTTSHGAYVRTVPLRLYEYLDRQAVRFADKIIAVSESERQKLLSSGLPAAKIIRVHNAIDTDAFVESANGRPAEPSGQDTREADKQHRRLILFAGRLNPQKGLVYLLESARHVTAAMPDVRFLIAGDGPLRDDLERKARELGVAEVVSFLGVRGDVGSLMRAADVFVLPSVEEPFGIVLLEALVLGRPVVATAVGGVPEIITHGETGLLVPPRDPAALATAILRLLKDPIEAARLGKQGRDQVQRKFSATEMVRLTADVYRGVLRVR